jgi:hypothetical protein
MDRLRHQLTAVGLSLAAAVVGGLSGCTDDRAAARAASAGIVDSILPREEALARFRAGLPAVTALAGGASTRDALVQRFATALERADTAVLHGLLLSKAEFAWLYYPTNPQALPPYDLPPGLMWDLLSLGSGKGLRRALRDFGGRPLAYRGYQCDPEASRQGDNTVSGPCTVTVASGDTTAAVRLFGLLVERAGRFKFVSYANQL